MLTVGFLFSLAYFFLSLQYDSWGVWIKRLNSFIMVAALMGFFYDLSIKGRSFNRFLSGSSLFIYIAHLIIGPMIVKCCLMIIPITNYTIFAIYLLGMAITVSLLIISYYLLGKMSSWVQMPLLGKRIRIDKNK